MQSLLKTKHQQIQFSDELLECMKILLPGDIIRIIVNYYEWNWRWKAIHKAYLITGGTAKQRMEQANILTNSTEIAMYGEIKNRSERIVYFTHDFIVPHITWNEARAKIEHYGDNSVEYPFYSQWFEPTKRRFAIVHIPDQSQKKRKIDA